MLLKTKALLLFGISNICKQKSHFLYGKKKTIDLIYLSANLRNLNRRFDSFIQQNKDWFF